MTDRRRGLSDLELDQRLAREDHVVPSPGFAARVMARVRTESAAPPAIPFPWTRALPGLAATLVAFVASYHRVADDTDRASATVRAWASESFAPAARLLEANDAALIVALAVTAGSLALAAVVVRGRTLLGRLRA